MAIVWREERAAVQPDPKFPSYVDVPRPVRGILIWLALIGMSR